jgi:4-alpha-glucanotransferase
MVLFYAGISPDVEKHHGENWKKTYVAPSPAPEHEPHGSHH